jgi:hypothetical protein
MAGSPGFEPGKPPPKGGVIPFHHDPLRNLAIILEKLSNKQPKYCLFFPISPPTTPPFLGRYSQYLAEMRL